MRYSNIVKGKFIERPNRFIAVVEISGKKETVHVKNTGRCKEILVPGADVYLEHAPSPNRKTDYSLISAEKGGTLINIDSQVPNHIVYEAILANKIEVFKNISLLKREVTYQSSRFDLYFESDNQSGFIEVKGVTLEDHHVAMFPDAPTQRGTRHVMEMIDAVSEGYQGFIFFLIQMKKPNIFIPNFKTDPEFAKALQLAHSKSVKILCYDCIVTKNSIEISEAIPISFLDKRKI